MQALTRKPRGRMRDSSRRVLGLAVALTCTCLILLLALHQEEVSLPLFSFGVISDVQFADIDDDFDFHHTKKRRYRSGIGVLEEAVLLWNRQQVAFAMQLGDLIDGKNVPRRATTEALKAVMRVVSQFHKPWFNLIGNHELYNFPRDELGQSLEVRREGSTYYSFSPHPGWQVVVLDPFDEAAIGWGEKHPKTEAAYRLLEKHNRNNVRAPADWFVGMEGLERRWVPFNGGLSKAQLQWLRQTLHRAGASGDRVIVMSHVPLHPGSCQPACLLWNYEEVLSTIRACNCVAATFSGHDHEGGHSHEEGIHHIVLKSPLETLPANATILRVEVHPHKLTLRNGDNVRELPTDDV